MWPKNPYVHLNLLIFWHFYIHFSRLFWYSVIFAATLYCQYSSNLLICWTSFLWMLSFLFIIYFTVFVMCWIISMNKLSCRLFQCSDTSTKTTYCYYFRYLTLFNLAMFIFFKLKRQNANNLQLYRGNTGYWLLFKFLWRTG